MTSNSIGYWRYYDTRIKLTMIDTAGGFSDRGRNQRFMLHQKVEERASFDTVREIAASPLNSTTQVFTSSRSQQYPASSENIAVRMFRDLDLWLDEWALGHAMLLRRLSSPRHRLELTQY